MTHTNRIRDTHRGSDAVGDERRHRRRMRHVVWSMCVGGTVAAMAWLAFWSPWFAVRDVRITGVTGGLAQRMHDTVAPLLDRHWLGVFPVGRTVFTLRGGTVAVTLRAAFPEIQVASADVQLPHTVAVTVTVRQPLGVWCRGDACTYWDSSGARWGNAVQSVGPLFLLVRDQRSSDDADPRLLQGIVTAVDGLSGLNLTARMVILPDAEPGGMRITMTSGYDVLMDGLGDVPDQLDTLRVFLAGRAKDTTFRPLYVDLRTPGRVYYK